VAQERLLGATTVSRPECPIVRRIQIQEAKAIDRALHFQSVPLNYVVNPLPGLLSAVGIKLNAVSKDRSTAGDRLEGHAIAGAGIERRRWSTWEHEESANPLGFGQWKRVEAESTFALKAQGRASFLVRMWTVVVEPARSSCRKS
jgi:hypothetical protein